MSIKIIKHGRDGLLCARSKLRGYVLAVRHLHGRSHERAYHGGVTFTKVTNASGSQIFALTASRRDNTVEVSPSASIELQKQGDKGAQDEDELATSPFLPQLLPSSLPSFPWQV